MNMVQRNVLNVTEWSTSTPCYLLAPTEVPGRGLPRHPPSAEVTWLPHGFASVMLALPGLLPFYTHLSWHLVFSAWLTYDATTSHFPPSI